MTATTLTEDQWDELMKPLLDVVLPQSGIARTFPHAVLYGAEEFQGTGLMHPWYNQELTHFQTCLDELNTDSFISELLRASFESLRLEIGYPGQLTEAPYAPLADAITDSWVKTVWKFAIEKEFSIADESPTLQLARQYDQFLMPAFVNAKYKGATLRKLNDYRKFLRVVSLADLTTANGKRICQDVLNGQAPQQTWHNYQWPRQQPSLSSEHRRLWREALTKCFLFESDNDRHLR